MDVGAGPLTVVGKLWMGHPVSLTAVDPLAAQYDLLLDAFHLDPPVRTVFGEVESLSKTLPTSSFDLVYMRNALDHSYDPLSGIWEMLRVVRPGGKVILEHFVNEAEAENYVGFHQWNLCEETGRFIIWNRLARYCVDTVVFTQASIATSTTGKWLTNVLTRRAGSYAPARSGGIG